MEQEKVYLCKQCRNIFPASEAPGPSNAKDLCCPKCGGFEVVEAPPWAPLGSGANIFEGNTWEYECQQCKKVFKRPIPRSPTEEKTIECPLCGGRHIHRLSGTGALPLYCG